MNQLLADIPVETLTSFLQDSETVELIQGEVLTRVGEPIQHIIFPIDCIISQWAPMKPTLSVEMGLIGNEGMLGGSVLLDVTSATIESKVQYSGYALRIPTVLFLSHVNSNPVLLNRCKHYLYIREMQIVQTGSCNCFHHIEERLARLLLMIRDRLHAQEFRIFQSELSAMLGVRRVGVTKAAGNLNSKNMIRYVRGKLQIIDSLGLETAACSCYALDNQIYASQIRI